MLDIVKFISVSVAFWLFATSADAQRINPRCMTMRDKIGCTCALENGGAIVPRKGGGWRWVSKTSGRQAVNDGFVQCMKRHGRG